MLRGLLSFSSMTMVSRVLGLVRDMSMSHVFGASAATDAFVIAFRIPNFMRRLFAEGSFSTAFVPVFTEVKETGTHEDLKQLMSRVSGTLGGVLLLVMALGLIFAPQVAGTFAPGALDQPHKFDLTTNLVRLTFPFILFVSLTALAGGALNSFHRFALPALAPVILNVCMIVGALWVAPRLGTPIMAMGWAVLLAGILQLLFLLPALRAIDLLGLPRWGWSHPQVRRIMRLMVPTLFGSSVAQLNLLLDTVVISLLLTGSQTWLWQSTRFLELPLGVFGVALGTVILPALSRHHVGTDRAGFSRALDWGLRLTLLISVPAMFALMLLAEPLVVTLFQNGRYTAFDAHMTVLSTLALCAGLPAYALVKVLLPAFYARQDTRTPVQGGRGGAGRQHGVQRPVHRDAVRAVGLAGAAGRAAGWTALPRCRACMWRWPSPARCPATSISCCSGAGCAVPASTSASRVGRGTGCGWPFACAAMVAGAAAGALVVAGLVGHPDLCTGLASCRTGAGGRADLCGGAVRDRLPLA